MEELLGKGEQALDKFLENPEQVNQAKAKAEDLLDNYVSHDQAQQITDTAANLAKKYADEHRS